MLGLARFRRCCFFITLFLSIAVILLFSIIQVNQRMARHQAERLMSDIRSISLRHTSFKQMGVILSRWSGSVRYKPPCSNQYCSVWILPRGGFLPFRLYGYAYRYPVLGVLYRFLGWNAAGATANLEVRNGFIWYETYVVREYVPPTFIRHGRNESGWYVIGGDISTIRSSWYPGDHPDYQMYRSFPEPLYHTVISSYASTEERQRLLQFNLSCLSRWLHPCRSPEDIMPVAMAEYKIRHAENERLSCNLEAVRIMSRDVDDAAIVELSGGGLASERNPDVRIFRVLLEQRLKGTQFWDVGTTREVEISDDDFTAPPSGSRLILLFGPARTVGGPAEKMTLHAVQCGVVPYSQETLAMVHLGVVQDDRVPPLDAYDSNAEYPSAFDPPNAPSIIPLPRPN
jgi:hypothetical protein